MLVVTTDEIFGWELHRVCGEVYGVHVRTSADPTNPVDGRAAALARMLEHARIKGGNAVVGLRLDTATFADGRMEICAYGTAVVAAPADEAAKQQATALGYGRPGASQGGGGEPAEQPVQPVQAAQPAQPYQQAPPQQYQPAQPYGQGQPGQQGQHGQQGQPYPQGYPQQPHYPQGYPGPQ